MVLTKHKIARVHEMDGWLEISLDPPCENGLFYDIYISTLRWWKIIDSIGYSSRVGFEALKGCEVAVNEDGGYTYYVA
jgi:hypothetical protein